MGSIAARLSPDARMQYAAYRLTRRRRTGISWQPFPNSPQELALDHPADELFYGGAAGGGKSDLLLGAALTRHQKSIIFRREFTQLQELKERSREIIGAAGRFNENLSIWRDLPGDRMLEFGGLKHEKDKAKYRGRPHDLKAFDELPEFTRTQYRFVIAWNRTDDPDQRTRVIASGNPPTDEAGRWVIEEWAPWLDPEFSDPAAPGELRWYYYDDEDRIVWLMSGDPVELDGRTVVPSSRSFIPAKLDDNPVLSATNYGDRLGALPPELRLPLLDGDFHATIESDPWQVIPTEWVKAAQRRWLERDEPAGPLSAVGVDVARGGRDRAVFAARRDNYFCRPTVLPGRDVPDGPTAALKLSEALGTEVPQVVNVDVIGVGASAYDSIRPHYPRVVAFNVGEGSDMRDKTGRFKMRNKRAAMYWSFRQALDPEHGDDIALPPGNDLVAEFCAAKYKVTTAGIQIEDKDDIKKRLGRSPDVAEAIMMAAYIEPRSGIPGIIATGKVKVR